MRYIRFIAIISLLIPAGPTSAYAQKAPQDCVVCGHACCCPDVCAPKILEMIKKDRLCGQPLKRHVSKTRASCDRPKAICSIQSEPLSGLINLRNETIWPNTKLAFVDYTRLLRNAGQERFFDTENISSLSIAMEIPTPPPRRLS